MRFIVPLLFLHTFLYAGVVSYYPDFNADAVDKETKWAVQIQDIDLKLGPGGLLKIGDMIIAADGKRVYSARDLQVVQAYNLEKDELLLVLLRNGRLVKVNLPRTSDLSNYGYSLNGPHPSMAEIVKSVGVDYSALYAGLMERYKLPGHDGGDPLVKHSQDILDQFPGGMLYALRKEKERNCQDLKSWLEQFLRVHILLRFEKYEEAGRILASHKKLSSDKYPVLNQTMAFYQRIVEKPPTEGVLPLDHYGVNHHFFIQLFPFPFVAEGKAPKSTEPALAADFQKAYMGMCKGGESWHNAERYFKDRTGTKAYLGECRAALLNTRDFGELPMESQIMRSQKGLHEELEARMKQEPGDRYLTAVALLAASARSHHYGKGIPIVMEELDKYGHREWIVAHSVIDHLKGIRNSYPIRSALEHSAKRLKKYEVPAVYRYFRRHSAFFYHRKTKGLFFRRHGKAVTFHDLSWDFHRRHLYVSEALKSPFDLKDRDSLIKQLKSRQLKDPEKKAIAVNMVALDIKYSANRMLMISFDDVMWRTREAGTTRERIEDITRLHAMTQERPPLWLKRYGGSMALWPRGNLNAFSKAVKELEVDDKLNENIRYIDKRWGNPWGLIVLSKRLRELGKPELADQQLAKALKYYESMHKAYDVTEQVAYFHSVVYVLADTPYFHSFLMSLASAVEQHNSHFLYGMMALSCYHANKRQEMLNYLAKSFTAGTRTYQGGKQTTILGKHLTIKPNFELQNHILHYVQSTQPLNDAELKPFLNLTNVDKKLIQGRITPVAVVVKKVQPTQPTFKAKVVKAHESDVHGLAYSLDFKTFYSASKDSTLACWHTENGTKKGELKLPSPLHDLQISNDGKTLYVGSAKGILVVEAQKLELVKTIAAESKGQIRLLLHGRSLIYGSGNGHLRRVGLAERKVLNQSQFKSGVRCLAVSQDRKQLAVGLLNGQIQILDLATWNEDTQLSGHQFGLRDLVWRTDGTLVSASDDMTIRFWKGAKEVKRLGGHDSLISGLAWHPQTKLLYSGGYDKTLIKWSGEGKMERKTETSGIIRKIISGPARAPIIVGCNDGSIHILTAP